MGNAELDVQYAFRTPRGRNDWRASVVGRVLLPTGTGPFAAGSVDLGAQVVAAKRLANRLDLYGGAGVTWFSDTVLRDVEYSRFRANVFLALEWQVSRRWSFIIDTWYTSRLIQNIWRYQEAQWYLDFAAKVDLSRNCTLELGLLENLANQQTTVDVGVHVGLQWRF